MSYRSLLILLLGLALGLPAAMGMAFWCGALLRAMGDEAGAGVALRVEGLLGAFWLAALVALLVTLALRSLNDASS